MGWLDNILGKAPEPERKADDFEKEWSLAEADKKKSEKPNTVVANTRTKTAELTTPEKKNKPVEFQSRITTTTEKMNWVDVPAVKVGMYTCALQQDSRLAVFDEQGNCDPLFTIEQGSIFVRTLNGGNLECKHAAFQRGRYVIFIHGSENVFMALEVAGDDNVIKKPRNWKRFSSYCDPNKLPEDLKKYTEDILTNERESPLGTDQIIGSSNDATKIVIYNTKMKKTVWDDNIPKVGSNIALDPKNPNIAYYCQREKPKELYRLDISKGDSTSWHSDPIPFPDPKPDEVRNLKLHPSGAFFFCTVDKTLKILRADTLQEIPFPDLNSSSNAMMTEDGHFYCQQQMVSNTGMRNGYRLIRLETNLDELAESIKQEQHSKIQKQRADTLKNFSLDAILAKPTFSESKTQTAAEQRDFSAFNGKKAEIRDRFQMLAKGARTPLAIGNLLNALYQVERELINNADLDADEVSYITDGIEAAIIARSQEIADEHVHTILNGLRDDLKKIDTLPLQVVTGLKDRLRIDEAVKQTLSPAILDEVDNALLQIDAQLHTLLESQEIVFIQKIDEMIAEETKKLRAMTKPSQFEHWAENELRSKQSWLGSLVRLSSTPPPKVLEKITVAQADLETLYTTFDNKFRTQLEGIREHESKYSDATAAVLGSRIDRFIDRLERKKFRSRDDADAFLRNNEGRKELELDIEAFAENKQSKSDDLKLTFRVHIENFLDELESRSKIKESTDGTQLIPFGNTTFPRFEGEVKKRGKRKVELTFVPARGMENELDQSKQAGDIVLNITTGDGHASSCRLWQGLGEKENRFRLGIAKNRGTRIGRSSLSFENYLAVDDLYERWKARGKDGEKKPGPLQTEYLNKIEKVRKHYELRERGNGKDKALPERSGADAAWKAEHLTLLKEFEKFCSENQIALLKRIDFIQAADDPEYANGSSFIPKWRNTWVIAPEDEALLEQMAVAFKKQLDPNFKEGGLLLKGHAGTGKDVLLRMFAERTRRPFFVFDCSPQTTEFDLSQDIALDERNGASFTIKEDSIVLRALETPGAILYFNEINNLSEKLQIFLNALLAEPRSVSLKTSSGRIVKAHESVLIAASMNPGYRGTNPLATSTRDRLDELPVGYAPLRQAADPDHPEPTDPFSASEALKIARVVNSLKDMSLSRNMERNEFVKAWNGEVNHIGEKSGLTQVQRFDMQVILGLVQFAEKLRKEYITGFEKSGKVLFVLTHPVTLRTLKSCANELNQIPDAEKTVGSNACDTAQTIMKKCLLQHIDSAMEKEKICTEIDTWPIEQHVM